MLKLITGGSGSGKSEYAENTALSLYKRLNADKLIYIATMTPYGKEAYERVARHRRQRAGKGFETMERYCNIKDINIDKNSVVLLECLSNLTANEVFDRRNQNASEDIVTGINRLCRNCRAVIAVTNEVFSDGCNYDSTTLYYIKTLADINRMLILTADSVTELVCGIPVKIKG